MSFTAIWKLAKVGLNVVKDAAAGSVAAWAANHFQLHRIGKMTSFKIDSAAQEIHVSLDLHGEVSPIELTIRYRLIEERDVTMIEVVRVESSREWIATLVNEMIPAEKKRQPLPPIAKAALTRIVK